MMVAFQDVPYAVLIKWIAYPSPILNVIDLTMIRSVEWYCNFGPRSKVIFQVEYRLQRRKQFLDDWIHVDLVLPDNILTVEDLIVIVPMQVIIQDRS